MSDATKTLRNELTAKSTDPTMVARATTYSGNVVRIVHVFSEEELAEYAEHCTEWDIKQRQKMHQNEKVVYQLPGSMPYDNIKAE